MKVTVRLDIKGEIVSRAMKERFLLAVASSTQDLIIDETMQGIFANGSKFQYSKSRKRVRDKQGLQTKFVDMIDTGQTVVQGMQVQQERNGEASLVIARDTEAWKRERWNRKRYNFFAINEKRKKRIDVLSKRIARDVFG